MDTAVRAGRSGPRVDQPEQDQRVQWRSVAAFTALAYAIAWAFWAPVWPDVLEALRNWRTASAYTGGSYAAFGMFAPAAAAVVMRLFISREGLRGSLGPVRGWRYYLVAVFGPIALVAATIAISVGTGLSEFTFGSDKPFWYVAAMLLLIGTPISAALAFGEEYGWRGYLLPRLLPLGEVKASVIVGLIWAPWHLPLLLAGLNYLDQNPLAGLAFMAVLGIGLSLLFTRLFVAAGGSVLVAAVMHGSLNNFSDRFSDGAHLSGNPFIVSVGGLVGFAVITVAVLLAYRRRRPAASDQPSRLPSDLPTDLPQTLPGGDPVQQR